VGRWEPGAAGRLAQAALELFHERGYEQTTVAEIAQRAGLTERTFFRHFADKREVFFAGSERLGELFARAVDDAPASLSPIAMVERAVDAGSAMLVDRTFSRRRQAMIFANPELVERERVKLARMADAVAEALVRRGVDTPAAQLAAEMGLTVFRLAFERWIASSGQDTMCDAARETFAALRTVAAPPSVPSRSGSTSGTEVSS